MARGRGPRVRAGRRSRSRVTALAALSRPRRGRSTSTRPPARPARRSGICSRTHRGCRSTGRRRSRGPASGGSTRTPASSSSPTRVAGRAEMPFADTSRRPCFEPLGMTPTSCAGSPASGVVSGRSSTSLPFARELLSPRLCAGDARRGDRPSRSPGSRACFRASAARIRTTGGSASSCATASRRTGPGARNSPRTFGHFGRAGHVPLGRPRCRRRPRLPDATSSSATGRWRPGRGSRTRSWMRPASVEQALAARASQTEVWHAVPFDSTDSP